MRIEIVAIGNELLGGFTINSNAAFISKQLQMQGWSVSRHTVLPDEEKELLTGLSEALERSDIVLCTGGLGPTGDDITRAAAAKLFQCAMRYDEEVANDLRRRFGDTFSTIDDQATIPEKAIALLNEVGSAPGLILSNEKSLLALLPGVPSEMKPLFIEKLLPLLCDKLKGTPRHYRRIINLWGTAEAAVDPLLRSLVAENPKMSYGIYPGLGVLSIHLIAQSDGSSSSKAAAMTLLEEPFQRIQQTFSSHSFAADSNTLEEAVHTALIARKQTLSVAESCTGGALSAKLTQRAGASQFFRGGVVAYSNELKTHMLNISAALIERHGAVSSQVVSAMTEGMEAHSGSDWTLAVSGIAGPDGATADKPVGTVWCAIKQKGFPAHSWQIQVYGSRTTIIERSTNALLGKLLWRLHNY